MKVKIKGNYYDFIESFAFSQGLDSVASSFGFTVVFNPEDENHRNIFRPLSYPKVEFFDDNDKKFFTGIILNHSFAVTAVPDVLALSGYSLSGNLEDCTIPYSLYPLESNKRSLKEIAERYLKPFNIKIVVEESARKDMSLVYEKTSAEPKDTIKEYLSKLASQRNILLSHNENGDLVFFKPDFASKPKFTYTEENSLNITLEVNGQNMHSDITILRQPEKKKTPKKKKKAAEEEKVDADGFPIGLLDGILDPDPKPEKKKKPKEKPKFYDSVHNSLVEYYRPIVEVLSEGDASATKNAALNLVAEEFKNIRINVDVDKWEDIRAGDVVEVQSPNIFVFKKLKLVVESFSKEMQKDSQTMSLSLMLPEAFTGNLNKENIFDYVDDK